MGSGFRPVHSALDPLDDDLSGQVFYPRQFLPPGFESSGFILRSDLLHVIAGDRLVLKRPPDGTGIISLPNQFASVGWRHFPQNRSHVEVEASTFEGLKY